MKKVIFLSMLVIVSEMATAKEISMFCHERVYQCSNFSSCVGQCDWITGVSKKPTEVTLKQDLFHTNSDHPYEIWRGRYQKQMTSGASIEMNFTTSNDPTWPTPIVVFISISSNGVVAESSGREGVLVGLRDAHSGSGFFCHHVMLK